MEFVDCEAGELWKTVHNDAGCFIPVFRYQRSRHVKSAIKIRNDVKDYVNRKEGLLSY